MTHSQSIRNVVVTSYVGAGKTSLVEALLFSAGVTSSMGTNANGNTVADFEAEEIQHHHSMSTALLQYEYKETFMNLLDAPGSLDFFADTKNTIHVADGAVLVVGTSGIRSELDRVWEYIQTRELPCLIFINELDKERAKFETTLAEIQEALEAKCVPIAYPIGEEANLRGVVDLVTQKAVIPVPNSHKVQEEDVPADLKEKIAELRKQLIETVAETNDELVEKYLSEGDLTQEEVLHGLILGTKTRQFIPVLCGSALLNLGTTVLQNAIIQCLPSPEERAEAMQSAGTHPQTSEELVRSLDAKEPFSRLCVQDDHRSLHGPAHVSQGLLRCARSRFNFFQFREKRQGKRRTFVLHAREKEHADATSQGRRDRGHGKTERNPDGRHDLYGQGPDRFSGGAAPPSSDVVCAGAKIQGRHR